ncbi:hypothetical protein WOB59_00480 [Methylocystis sp. IM4]|uniref:hypothetical protein n=1 Tax=Methylocystis sp. IM4 TaxID=3136560 RepID=UPI00311996FA
MRDLRTPFLPLPERFALWRLSLRWRLARLRRGLLYGVDRLSTDDAQRVLFDCQSPAGWHPLLTLTLADVLEEARETFEDHPALPRLVNDACGRVADKWQNYGDELYEARRWAMNLVKAYADDENIALRPREDEDCEEDDAKEGAVS